MGQGGAPRANTSSSAELAGVTRGRERVLWLAGESPLRQAVRLDPKLRLAAGNASSMLRRCNEEGAWLPGILRDTKVRQIMALLCPKDNPRRCEGAR